jgi:hypothetical protein
MSVRRQVLGGLAVLLMGRGRADLAVPVRTPMQATAETSAPV